MPLNIAADATGKVARLMAGAPRVDEQAAPALATLAALTQPRLAAPSPACSSGSGRARCRGFSRAARAHHPMQGHRSAKRR
jgi:hypothetical protein